ncbi:MAG: thermonuclease family protein [Propionicimonas sp.]
MFVSVVDGDTIRTEAGTVRIIGIDAPERGECGHQEASATIEKLLAPGDLVWLELPPGQNDRDRHGRLVRFVTTESGVDVGLAQLEAGNAVARYDSTDGYPEHPREAAYHAAQIATRDADGGVVTTSCANPTTPPAGDRWWEQYQSCGQLKRNTNGHPTGPFNRDNPAEADIYDWFANQTGNNGDGDGDGLACE